MSMSFMGRNAVGDNETAILKWIDKLYRWRLKATNWRHGSKMVSAELPPDCPRNAP